MPRKFNRHLDNKHLKYVPPTHDTTHDVACTECPAVFACACHDPENHSRRRDRSWPDRCPSCERAVQVNWKNWLDSAPEAKTFEPLPERKA